VRQSVVELASGGRLAKGRWWCHELCHVPAAPHLITLPGHAIRRGLTSVLA